MSDFSELLTGIAVLIVSIGIMVACLPRGGKTAWLAGKPFLAPALSIVIVGGIAMGLILIVAYFTTIDDVTLSGKPHAQIAAQSRPT